MKTLRSFSRIVDSQTLYVLLLSVAATYFCRRMNWAVQLSEGLIAIAIIFPLGFAINAAFSRREKVLELYASLKASAIMLYLSHRDWLHPIAPELLDKVRNATRDMLHNINEYVKDPKADDTKAIPVYASFSKISGMAEQIRAGGAYPADAARVNRGLAQMAIDFERIRNVRNYRTPHSLRAYSQVFLNLIPILFAPHFANIAPNQNPALSLIIAALYSMLLVSLDNIQEALEDPFDQHGEDDVLLDAVTFFDLTINAVATTHPSSQPTILHENDHDIESSSGLVDPA